MNTAATSTDNPEIGRFVTANGIRTNVHEMGEDGPPVLLIHGSGPGVSAWANWRLNMPVLAESCRVIAPDCVGFGYTDRPEGVTYDQSTWVEHLLGVMDALDVEKADIVGNSFGGSMALAMAIHHPERVNRVVLMGSVGIEFELTPGLDTCWGYESSIENMHELLGIFAYDQSLVSGDLAKLRYEAAARPGVCEAFSAMFPAPRQRWITALAHDEQAIAKIEHPALILHGREDRIIPPANAQRLFDLIPNSEMHLFGHCGHWTQIEHKDRFNTLLTDFLSYRDDT